MKERMNNECIGEKTKKKNGRELKNVRKMDRESSRMLLRRKSMDC